jgi:hypothetical protein
MNATRLLAFIHLHSAVGSAAAEPSAVAPRRAWVVPRWTQSVISWLVGGLDSMGEVPENYLGNNHLRRDIGLPPVGPGGWPY